MAKQKKKLKRRKKVKVILTPQQKLQKKNEVKLHKNILSLYRNMGFEYIRTEKVHMTFDGHRSDIDDIFLFENIILICEETTGKDEDHEHLRKKNEFYTAILSDKTNFIKWLKSIGKEKFSRFNDYPNARYKIFYLYCTDNSLEPDRQNLYPKVKFIDGKKLNYFLKVANTIKYSAKYEFFKFLNLQLKDIGNFKENSPDNIYSAVLFPEDVMGMPKGVHVVSFVMTPKELLDCAYVFRKENWDQDAGYYYQRLIDKNKIESIRNFLVKEQRTFIDNIIVSLPHNVKFNRKDDSGADGVSIDLENIDLIEANAVIKIPYSINSIGIIDGQHRVFGHHEGPPSKDEKIISSLRDKRHLFVTGLFYKKNSFKESEKRKFESKLFLEINSKQKKVSPQILQHIESLQDPLSPIGISISVLRDMNGRTPFKNLFLLSELEKKGIKTPTIIKYGLQQLVEIDDLKETLFKYWVNPNKLHLKEGKDSDDELLRKEYVKYCTDSICKFFIAVQHNFKNAWIADGSSKLLTVTSIVAFLKSFNKSLEVYKGIKDITFYQTKIKLDIDFLNRKTFPYVSSQWPKFAEVINKSWT